MTERITEVMKDPTRIRNIATSSHVHHGKTTLTDNLMAGAGMIAEEMAGKYLTESHGNLVRSGRTKEATDSIWCERFDGTRIRRAGLSN